MENNSFATHHIKANKGDIASTVFMMGDPLRAKQFANDHLENARLICDIRGINIWSGEYNGQPLTVMGHGMGMSSMAIYAHELFEFFGVEKIVRLGSSASYTENLNQGDIIVGDKYWTYSRFSEGYGVDSNEPALASNELVEKFRAALEEDGTVNFGIGGIYTSNWFYAPSFFGEGIKKGSTVDEKLNSNEIIGKEMEGYALQVIANHFNKQAITVVTVIDNLKTKQFSSADDKVDTSKMGMVALKAIFGK